MGNCCYSGEKVKLLAENSHLGFEFISASDVPKADTVGTADPYIRAWISTADTVQSKSNRPISFRPPVLQLDKSYFECNYVRISRRVETLFAVNNQNPVWNSYKDFKIIPPVNAFLVIQLYNKDDKYDIFLGQSIISLSDFENDIPITRPITYYGISNKEKYPNFSIKLRQLKQPRFPYKTIFCIRHGESEWNADKSKGNISRVLRVDHPLTKKGIEQAKTTNKKWKLCLSDLRLSKNSSAFSSNHSNILTSIKESSTSSRFSTEDDDKFYETQNTQ